ncbi:glycosyltransferase [Acinetobacter gerneri]|uniref:Glycosyl transferase family 1 domain-containing protein n=1 Tax=Acinetobacter gerneri DSM 14967 = CIP 107464 = MTCC 9824 TaxID=1120926 RepID=N8ZSQ1_9GAMM|nr:glycosyltransferase [Acinetobacter gerneri]ENV34778.1 hypothetical protein F960_01086 [Acinetobacter gerneri DSM 14967 = CIP 107464 = MTCC 9824]EPR85444.1 glycosyl transferase, group 1 [Acinetobacter gerneri DSM 14967 = CIP 107464 = MTCC 9824]
MSANVVIIMNDYTKMGGVEKVTSNLSKLFMSSNIKLFGIISLNQEFNEPKIQYPVEMPIFLMSIEEIQKFIQENKITHVIIQTQLLKETVEILKEIKELKVKKFPILHNTPYAYLNYFYEKNNLKGFLKYLKMILVTKQRSMYFFRKIVELSDKFLLVSKKAEIELKSILPIKFHNKISYIYNAQDIQKENNVNFNKENIIVYAGRLAYDKQVFKAIQLLEPILKNNSDWSVEILGDGPEREIIEKFIIDNNINNIFLRGSVDNVFEYLSRSKISFLYSLYEGLPTSMLEASICKNVLIGSSSKGGISDIIENNVNGFIVENDSDFVKKIESLIENDILNTNLRNGNSIVLKKFNNTRILESWEKLFI